MKTKLVLRTMDELIKEATADGHVELGSGIYLQTAEDLQLDYDDDLADWLEDMAPFFLTTDADPRPLAVVDADDLGRELEKLGWDNTLYREMTNEERIKGITDGLQKSYDDLHVLSGKYIEEGDSRMKFRCFRAMDSIEAVIQDLGR